MNNETNDSREHDVSESIAETSGLPKWLAAEVAADDTSRVDDDRSHEESAAEYEPEAIFPGEDQNDDQANAHAPVAVHIPTDDELDLPMTEFADYSLMHHELIELAWYWARESLKCTVNGILGFSRGCESRFAALCQDRLRRIATLVGADEVQRIVEQVKGDYRWSLGDRVWEIFRKGSRADLETVRAEISVSWPESDMAAPPVPQGVLPADVGAVDCTPKIWQVFDAFCLGSGLREKHYTKVWNLWNEFISRRK